MAQENYQEAVRYEVTAKSSSSAVIDSFIDWVKAGHGQDLLDCEGCCEYRVLRVNQNTARAEYLFSSQDMLEQYIERDAPRLREDGVRKFAGVQISFERSQAELCASVVKEI